MSVPATPAHRLPDVTVMVLAAADLRVRLGVHAGAAMGGPGEVCEGDLYTLAAPARARPLRLVLPPPPALPVIAAGSPVGRPGDPVEIAAGYTMMSSCGARLDLLVLRCPAGSGAGAGTDGLLLLPLGPLVPRRDLALIRVQPAPLPEWPVAPARLCFARGTRIALPTGALVPVETLAPGVPVLTRDHGPRPIRGIASVALRATGPAAPVVFAPGALGNAGLLAVGAEHRLFLYRPEQRPAGAGPLVAAGSLVDGQHICRREGGHVDYVGLGFDRPEVIYAEGIPAESLPEDGSAPVAAPGGPDPELAARLALALRTTAPADADASVPMRRGGG